MDSEKKQLQALCNRLDKVSWKSPGATDQVTEIYSSFNFSELRQAAIHAPRSLIESPKSSEVFKNYSRRKPTHLKLFLGGEGGPDSIDHYSLWLHFYSKKWAPELGSGAYVENYHNQRYDFVSLILAGGYTADEVRPTATPTLGSLDFWQPDKEEWTPRERAYIEGDIAHMHAAIDIHRLRQIGNGTITLLIQGPSVRETSQEFNEDGHLVRDHPNLRAALRSFTRGLGALS